MDKIKALVPMMAFLLLLAKGLSQGMSQNDVAALLILASLYGFSEFGMEKQKIKKIEQEIKELNEKIAINEKRTDEVRTHVGALKFGQQQRSGQAR